MSNFPPGLPGNLGFWGRIYRGLFRVFGPAQLGDPREPAPAPLPEAAPCPRCGGTSRQLSRFGPSPCLSMHVCLDCAEPFEQVRAL